MATTHPVVREGFLRLGNRHTWYRTYGERTDLPALLMLHGGPGGASPDDVPFVNQIARERLVVMYDQLETGRSQRLGDVTNLSIENHIGELNAVRAALDLDAVHVWGQSWGGSLAMEYALTGPDGLRSITVASGPHSFRLWQSAVTEMRAALPPRNLRALERCERTLLRRGPVKPKAGDGPTSAKLAKQGAVVAKAYGAVLSAPVQAVARAASYVPPLRRGVYYVLGLEFSRRHVFRGRRVPPGGGAALLGMNMAVYEHLWGPSEHFPTGPLKDFDLTDRLHEIAVPVLVTTGGHEAVWPEHVEQLVARVPDVQWELFADAAHASEFEAPERYTHVLSEFLTKIDGR